MHAFHVMLVWLNESLQNGGFSLAHVSFSQAAGWQLTKQLKITKQPGTHLKQTP